MERLAGMVQFYEHDIVQQTIPFVQVTKMSV